MRRTGFIFCVLTASLLAGSALAQQESIFANPENLKVLPKDISEGDLRNTMRYFSLGLGVRCEFCHEQNEETHKIDFPSDAKPEKAIARDMIRMVGRINGTVKEALEKHELAEDEEGQQGPVPVRCVTCHRGQPHPRLIQDVLDTKVAEGGVEAAITEYMALRGRYYGSHTFDFSPKTLGDYADQLAERGEGEASIRLHKLNLELDPDNAVSYWQMGNSYRRLGRLEEAAAAYRKALELDPEHMGFVRRLLDQIQQEMEGSGQ